MKGSCPLLALPSCEVVVLDDFRPNPDILDIPTLLRWLEGTTVTVARPLNTYGSHLQFKPQQPHFATCSFAALHTARGKLTETELSMLRNRLQIYLFQRRIEEIRPIPCCVNCFAMWILSGGRNVTRFLDRGFPAVDGNEIRDD